MTASIETPFPATIKPMETSNHDPIDLTSFTPQGAAERVLFDRVKKNSLKVDILQSLVNKHREDVRSLFKQINDHIKDESLDKNGSISIEFLGEVLLDVFNSELLFLKDYKVRIVHSIESDIIVTASDEEEARQLAEEMGISEIHWDVDEDVVTVDSDWVINNTQTYEVRWEA